uniref:(northern house mosquito) hypothetical protein n=1 Tax=Culex pipiens TaxID=7175 RepID=A0A8D8A7B3_CULPI
MFKFGITINLNCTSHQHRNYGSTCVKPHLIYLLSKTFLGFLLLQYNDLVRNVVNFVDRIRLLQPRNLRVLIASLDLLLLQRLVHLLLQRFRLCRFRRIPVVVLRPSGGFASVRRTRLIQLVRIVPGFSLAVLVDADHNRRLQLTGRIVRLVHRDVTLLRGGHLHVNVHVLLRGMFLVVALLLLLATIRVHALVGVVELKVTLLDLLAELDALLHQQRAQVHVPARSLLGLHPEQVQRTLVVLDHVQLLLLQQ